MCYITFSLDSSFSLLFIGCSHQGSIGSLSCCLLTYSHLCFMNIRLLLLLGLYCILNGQRGMLLKRFILVVSSHDIEDKYCLFIRLSSFLFL